MDPVTEACLRLGLHLSARQQQRLRIRNFLYGDDGASLCCLTPPVRGEPETPKPPQKKQRRSYESYDLTPPRPPQISDSRWTFPQGMRMQVWRNSKPLKILRTEMMKCGRYASQTCDVCLLPVRSLYFSICTGTVQVGISCSLLLPLHWSTDDRWLWLTNPSYTSKGKVRLRIHSWLLVLGFPYFLLESRLVHKRSTFNFQLSTWNLKLETF